MLSHTIKFFISIIILMVIVLGISYMSHTILHKTSRALAEEIARVEDYAVSNDWSSAAESLKKVQEKWAGTKKIWAMLIDHFEIDNIEITLTRVEQFILCKDASSALAEASALMKYVRHIPQKEAFSLENIF